jgi:hypothetical protein
LQSTTNYLNIRKVDVSAARDWGSGINTVHDNNHGLVGWDASDVSGPASVFTLAKDVIGAKAS